MWTGMIVQSRVTGGTEDASVTMKVGFDYFCRTLSHLEVYRRFPGYVYAQGKKMGVMRRVMVWIYIRSGAGLYPKGTSQRETFFILSRTVPRVSMQVTDELVKPHLGKYGKAVKYKGGYDSICEITKVKCIGLDLCLSEGVGRWVLP